MHNALWVRLHHICFLLTNHIERQFCFPVTITTRVMLACTGTHGPIHIPGQCISREAQGRSLSTDRTFQIATLELGIVCIRVACFHTTRDITSVTSVLQCWRGPLLGRSGSDLRLVPAVGGVGVLGYTEIISCGDHKIKDETGSL